MAEKYFSDGPKPRTERGLRRHAARNQEQHKHARNVHVDRQTWLKQQAWTPFGQEFGSAKV